MKRLIIMLFVGVLSAGCAGMSGDSSRTSLAGADAKLAAGDYPGARALYADFVNANPKDAQVERARATRVALERLLTLQTELERLQKGEVTRLQRELSAQQGETDRLKAEVAKLRADLERLRNIDLQERRESK